VKIIDSRHKDDKLGGEVSFDKEESWLTIDLLKKMYPELTKDQIYGKINETNGYIVKIIPK
jgi:hypothetical protein